MVYLLALHFSAIAFDAFFLTSHYIGIDGSLKPKLIGILKWVMVIAPVQLLIDLEFVKVEFFSYFSNIVLRT